MPIFCISILLYIFSSTYIVFLINSINFLEYLSIGKESVVIL